MMPNVATRRRNLSTKLFRYSLSPLDVRILESFFERRMRSNVSLYGPGNSTLCGLSASRKCLLHESAQQPFHTEERSPRAEPTKINDKRDSTTSRSSSTALPFPARIPRQPGGIHVRATRLRGCTCCGLLVGAIQEHQVLRCCTRRLRCRRVSSAATWVLHHNAKRVIAAFDPFSYSNAGEPVPQLLRDIAAAS